MALIPADLAFQTQQQLYHPSSAPINQLSLLDNQMKTILEDSNLPPEQKLRQYYDSLRKFEHIQNTEFRIPIPVKLDPEQSRLLMEKNSHEKVVQLPELPVPEHDVIETIPQAQRRGAKLLLKHIQENPLINWNDKKELIYRGERIPNSNFHDLIQDMSLHRKRNHTPAHGWKEFSQALISHNVPIGAIGNHHRQQQIRRQMYNLQNQSPMMNSPVFNTPIYHDSEGEDDLHSIFETPKRKSERQLKKKKNLNQRGYGFLKWESLY